MAPISSSASSGPVHVLLATPPAPEAAAAADSESNDARRRQWESNPRLQNDYLARRAKADGIAPPLHLWSGVTQTEQALVNCCEVPEEEAKQDDFFMASAITPSGNNSKKGIIGPEYPMTGGGALDMEKEVRFVGILAKDCHCLSTRALALAILERTLETHLWEQHEAQQRLRVNQLWKEEEDKREKEAAVEQQDEEENEEDEEDDETQPGQKRRSRRLLKQDRPKYKRTKRKEESSEESSSKKDKSKFDYEKWNRLEQFFAAGGLRILNRWLFEASEDEVVKKADTTAVAEVATSSNKSRANRSSGDDDELVLKASSTRPLILPMLRFLERIPFDKKLVVDSKINKQIKNIGKQVNAILDQLAKGKNNPEDLENWTTEPTTSQADALDIIKEAIEQLKKAWGEKTKTEKDSFSNPFDLLNEDLRERLEAVEAFESGAAPRPDWLEFPGEVVVKENKAKRSRSELAAKEREAELKIRQSLNETLQRQLRQAEQAHREHLAKIREVRNRELATKVVPLLDFKKKSGGREVQWKDGMKSKAVRNRQVLEEVFVFDKNKPSNPECIDTGDDEDGRDGTAPQTTTTSTNEPEDGVVGDELEADDDMIDLSLL